MKMSAPLVVAKLDEHLESIKGLLPQMKLLSCMVKELNAQFNSGKLNFIIDPTVLLEQIVVNKVNSYERLSEDAIDSSMIDVVLTDNIQSIEGEPLWQIMRGEDCTYYELFKVYKNLSKSGVRSIYRLAEVTGVKVRTLKLLSEIWQWNARANAYDTYIQYESEITRNQHRALMENEHRDTARELFNQARAELFDRLPEMEGKELVKVLEMAVRLERSALGMDPDKPYTYNKSSSSEVNINVNSTENRTVVETQITPKNRTDTEEQLSDVLQELFKVGALEIRDMEPIEDDTDNRTDMHNDGVERSGQLETVG